MAVKEFLDQVNWKVERPAVSVDPSPRLNRKEKWSTSFLTADAVSPATSSPVTKPSTRWCITPVNLDLEWTPLSLCGCCWDSVVALRKETSAPPDLTGSPPPHTDCCKAHSPVWPPCAQAFFPSFLPQSSLVFHFCLLCLGTS